MADRRFSKHQFRPGNAVPEGSGGAASRIAGKTLNGTAFVANRERREQSDSSMPKAFGIFRPVDVVGNESAPFEVDRLGIESRNNQENRHNPGRWLRWRANDKQAGRDGHRRK